MRSLFDNLSANIITAAERSAIVKLLKDAGFDPAYLKLAFLAGDGSERRFLRVGGQGRSLVLILPNPSSPRGLDEARSSWLIGRHLHDCGVPVPEIYGYDPETGIVICEDLGDSLLHDKVSGGNLSDEKLTVIYEQAVLLLAHMQVVGGSGFEKGWCWETVIYDRQLMLSRESGYFMESFCRGFLGITKPPPGLGDEFVKLAELASAAPAVFFLHRDFQSRNIMCHNGRLRLIDFQGGRLGPLGYDLASLLIDPYVCLSDQLQEKLLQNYIDVLAEYPETATAFSVDDYYLLALQRNLQILGAFAFLSKVKGKSFFRAYLGPAMSNLNKLLQGPMGCRFPILRLFAGELPGVLDNLSG